MTTLRHEIDASCPPERVWALLADLTAVERYNPTVRRAWIEGSQRTGVGAQSACELASSGRVVERVTRWDEGSALGVELAEHAWPVTFMRWVTRVEATSGGARVVQDLE